MGTEEECEVEEEESEELRVWERGQWELPWGSEAAEAARKAEERLRARKGGKGEG